MSRLLLPCLGLVLVSLAHPLAAQQTDSAVVRVRVVSDRDPVQGARVGSGSMASVTEADGRAILRLPAGEARLRATRGGFEPSELTLSLRPGQDTTVIIELEPAESELEDIVVSVTRSSRRLADQPTRIEVVGQEEIEEKLLMTPGDIAMLLNETGGLRVQHTSPSLGAANVRVQGLRGRYTLMLSDGLPLHGEAAGGPGLLQVPPMDLGQVEVLKGAASALYGSAALGGAINLISRRPSGEREVLLNATSQGGTDVASWLSGIISPVWGWSLYSGWHRQGRRDLDDDGWTDLPGYRRWVVRPRLHFDDARGNSLLATAGMTLETRKGGTLPSRVAPDGEPWVEANRSSRLDAGVAGRAAIGEATFLTIRGSGLTQRHRHEFGPTAEPDRHTTGFLESSFVQGLDRVVLVIGAAVQGDWYRSEAVSRFDFSHTTAGVFAHAEWDPAEQLGIGASLRLDHHNRYGTFASPRLSILARPATGWTARVSAGAGYFGPTPLVEEVEATGLGVLRQTSVLQAERVLGGSADLTWHGGDVELSATLFASRVRHPVATTHVVGGAPDELLLANQEEPVHTRGAELLGRVHRRGLHLTASYTWIDATEARTGEARRPVPLNPRHALGVVGMYEWEGSGRIGLEFYAVGRQSLEDNPFRSESPSYLIVGALVEKQVGWARLFLNFENLTDVRQTNTDPLVRPTRGEGGRWTTDAWGPLEGRVVNGGVKLSW
ncbi:MAG TPA: TonB-dependent receptor [Gemmatimonadales bacterium]|nr:TonB-dependent receptor [Gemmatimonadales bacterium]